MAAAQQALARPAGRRTLQPRASRAGQRLGARRRRRQAVALDVGALGDALAGDASTFADALGELPAAARYGAFAALYCSSALVFFPPTAVLSVGAGALWGPTKGVAAVSVSSTLAACVAFVAARSALRPFAARVAGGALERLERSVERVGAARAVVLARLTPVLPYELSNYAFGLCEDVPLPTFALCSWAAMLPGTVVFVVGGGAAGAAAAGDGAAAARAAALAVAALALVGAAAPLVVDALGGGDADD